MKQILREDFIRDQGPSALPTEPKRLLLFGLAEARAGGIVRMHHHTGPDALRSGPQQRLRIQLPSALGGEPQAVWDQADVVEICQIIEERVTGPRDQDF